MRQGDALADVINRLRGKLVAEQKVRPPRLKPHLNQASYRRGEPVRQPKSNATPTFPWAVGDALLPEGRKLDQIVVGNSFHRVSGLAPGTQAAGDYVDFES